MINVSIIIGRLTKDPSYKYYEKTKKQRCTFRVAVPKGWFSDKADFVPITVWGKDAAKCRDNLFKGNWVAVQGKLTSRYFKDKKDKSVFILELESNEVFFIDKSKSKTKESKDSNMPDLSQLPFSNLDLDQIKFYLDTPTDKD